MTTEKYEELKKNILGLISANEWLRRKMLAAPKEQTSLNITFKTPHMIYLSPEVEIDDHSIIYGNVTIAGNSVIGHHCILYHNVCIEDSKFGSYVYVGPNAQITRSTIGHGTDIPHHCYIGDTSIGMYCNIGAGFITSNFEGTNKYKTVIGNGCFIGTDVDIISPITIGNEVRIFPQMRVVSKKQIPDHAFVIPKIEGGREIIDILENRSFMLMPGKWLLTKKPIKPEHMKEYLEKVRLLFKDPWQALSTPLSALSNKTHIDILKAEGEEGLAKLMDELGHVESGSFS